MTVDLHAQNRFQEGLSALDETRTEMQQVLDAVFRARAERPPVSVEEEQELIYTALAGNNQAFVQLVLLYAPLLRKIAEPYRSAAHLWEETLETIIGGLWAAIAGFDPSQSDRLGAHLWSVITEAVHEERDPMSLAIAVPGRTLRRATAVQRRIRDGEHLDDVIADTPGITREAYLAVEAARNMSGFRDTDSHEPEHISIERYDAAHLALAQVDDLQREVCRWYYGFNSEDPILSDAGTAEQINIAALGEEAAKSGQSVIYTRKVNRARTSALQEMREFLAD
jgi:hypothetical protein